MPAVKPTLRIGSRADVVKDWQRIIGVEPDGVFGSGTQAATKAWQAVRGLKDDGVVGPATWAAAETRGKGLTGLTLKVKTSAVKTASMIPNIGAMPTWAKWYLGLMTLSGIGYGIAYTVRKRPR
jgi:peptidoglycan hydrolase-like protein with peptidoglycan-binding domain